ncbi:site-specific DNA-methyltransferase [Flavobacteriaceae bacterium]|jgi:DNA modification methylase|nr:site-specific DNA-methyltransferase [Flavobacteriaceae bacterium]
MILKNIKKGINVDNSPQEIIKNISKLEWKDGLYGKQSWGHSLHKIAPYVGRIKPPFAHFLIKYVTKPGDIILDPFCGIGTIPLEGSLCGRNTIGVDLNPYAIAVSNAKTQHNLNLEDLIEYVENLEIISKGVSIRKIPDWVKEYYNKNTLKEILYTLDILKADKQKFIYGCLVGISQGHRPGHLSKPCAWTLPYKPRPDDPGEYRDVKTRLIAKIKRNYKDKIESSGSIKILKEDSRRLSLENESVNHIISSPPYYNTLDYVNSHRLRLAICGVYNENEKKALRDQTIQRYKDYIDEMRKVIVELYRVLKPGGYCVFVVGDHFKGKLVINTSEELAILFKEIGFTYYGSIEDPIPVNKSVQKTTKKVKFERIMLLQK